MIEKRAKDFVEEVVPILAEREGSHGSKIQNMQAVARLWNAYLHTQLGSNPRLTGTDVCHMMVQLKQARYQIGNPSHEDHFLDAIGYTAIAGECAMEEFKPCSNSSKKSEKPTPSTSKQDPLLNSAKPVLGGIARMKALASSALLGVRVALDGFLFGCLLGTAIVSIAFMLIYATGG